MILLPFLIWFECQCRGILDIEDCWLGTDACNCLRECWSNRLYSANLFYTSFQAKRMTFISVKIGCRELLWCMHGLLGFWFSLSIALHCYFLGCYKSSSNRVPKWSSNLAFIQLHDYLLVQCLFERASGTAMLIFKR